jgi:hypothetical protein
MAKMNMAYWVNVYNMTMAMIDNLEQSDAIGNKFMIEAGYRRLQLAGKMIEKYKE